MRNDKYDPAITLTPINAPNLSGLKATDARGTINVAPTDLDYEFEKESVMIAQEIDELKKTLLGSVSLPKINIMAGQSRSREMDGADRPAGHAGGADRNMPLLFFDHCRDESDGAGIQSGSEPAELESSMQASEPPASSIADSIGLLRSPVVDETHLLLQSLPVSSADLESPPSGSERSSEPDELIMYWDCRSFLHSDNAREPIHVGKPFKDFMIEGMPGTIFFTTSTVLFIMYYPRIKSENVDHAFAYYDANLNYLSDFNFSEYINQNFINFETHGIFKSKFPELQVFTINFSWPNDPEVGNFKTQSFKLRSLLQRIKAFGARDPPMPFVGRYSMLSGVSPFDEGSFIHKIKLDIKQYYPAIYEVLLKKYPGLYKQA